MAPPQRAIVSLYTLIALLYCAASVWLFETVAPSRVLSLVHLVALAAISVNYVVLRLTGNDRLATHVILSVGTLVVGSLYATGGWRETGFLWTFAYLPYAFFLASRAVARLWVGILLAVDLALLAADLRDAVDVPYDGVQHLMFYASLTVFLLCMFLFKGAVLDSEATAHRRAEELAAANRALVGRELELMRAQSLARMGSWTWTPATDQTTWSPQMGEIFGLRADDPPLTLSTFRDHIHPDDAKPFAEALQRTLEQGLPMDVDCRVRRRDGAIRVLHAMADAERDRQGRVVRLVGTSQDVTELRAAEEQRRLASLRLQEIEGLKEVNRFKSQFLNTAAHELSTPLTPIRLQLHTLRSSEGVSPQKRQHALELLERNVHRLAALVQDLLEGAKLQSSQLALDRKPVDLAALVADGVRNQMPVAKERGVALHLEAAGPLWTYGDPRRLAQVIDNLLANAVKFTPPGNAVHVRTVRASGGMGLFVRDEGIGIRPEALAKLFQPFSQVHDTSQQTRAGTGLGLYICKGIIEAHGGRIGAESPGLGKGATFWFVLGEGDAPALGGPPPPDAA